MSQQPTRLSLSALTALLRKALHTDELTLDAAEAAIPTAAIGTPMAEKTGGAVGGMANQFARADHQHPRLTSVTIGQLGAAGVSGTLTFTRPFAAEPGVVLTPIAPGGTQPVMLQVDSWVRATMTPAPAGDYVGCVVKGYRGQLLPTLSLGALLTAVIGALSGVNPAGGSAAGVRFSCIAVARSDV